MNTNWDLLVENHFAARKQKPLVEILNQLIEQVMAEALDFGMPEVLGEEGETAGTQRTYTIDDIPLIPISELGWANARTPGKGSEPPPEQRTQLEQYLSNIGGTNLVEKLDAISKFYNNPPTGRSGDRKQYIREVLSFLVFFKTLTLAITNFNASAAGFNFEAFLSVLLKGRQIPASGAGTIADIAVDYGDGVEIPLSLKLYNEKGLEVGGSFRALCNDLINDASITNAAEWEWGKSQPGGGAMRYLACTKNFYETEGLDQTGHIDFYQLDITRENVFEVLILSKKGRACIKLPEVFVTRYNQGERNPEMLDISKGIPAAAEKPEPSIYASTFAEYLELQISEIEEFDDQVKATFVEQVAELYEKNMEASIEKSGGKLSWKFGGARGPGVANVTSLALITQQVFYPDYKGPGAFKRSDEAKYWASHVASAYALFSKEFIKSLDLRKAALEEIVFLSPEESLKAYAAMRNDPEILSLALRNTIGYLRQLHWLLARGMVYDLAGGKIAALEIGSKKVGDLLEKVRNDLMKEVFEIFSAVQELSRDLNAFFAGGLNDPKLAEKAIESANLISTRTEEVADVKGDEAM
jgi:hypothetical protein